MIVDNLSREEQLNSLFNHGQWNVEPFSRLMTNAVLVEDIHSQSCCIEEAVDEAFKLLGVYVVTLENFDHLDFCQQVCRAFLRLV